MILGDRGNCEQTHNFGICLWQNTRKTPQKSIKMKISKIGLRHVLSWFKMGLEPKFGGGDKKNWPKISKRGSRVLGIKECDAWWLRKQTYHFGICLWKTHTKNRLRYVLSWFKVGLEPKFHEAMTFSEWGNHKQKWQW